ncbi:hypothetical protein [Paenibacillus tundrae]|uniref:hypothetical protein n=1 Tax=Paenibacillus tundrae TaxID=528187 RepID=UPI0030CB50CC
MIKDKQRIGISSPTTALPEKQFIELKACIAEANHILRTLGNPPQPNNTRQLELKLASLQDQYVEVQMSFRGKLKTVDGFLLQSGKNYITIWSNSRLRYVQYDQLISISTDGNEAETTHETHPIFCSEELNCALLYTFTETVSGSVMLLNRFYGIPLSIALLQHAGQKIIIQMTEPKSIKMGCLVNTTEDKIIIQPLSKHEDQLLETIALTDIEVITIAKQ